MASLIQKYNMFNGNVATNGKKVFLLCEDGTVAQTNQNSPVAQWRNVIYLSGRTSSGIACVTSDGKIQAEGFWRMQSLTYEDIVAVECLSNSIACLRSDGTVFLATSWSSDKKSNMDIVSTWQDIIAISASTDMLAGLKKDGTVVVAGSEDKSISDQSKTWKNVVAISVGRFFLIGLLSDGTCVSVGLNTNGQCNVENWKDIVSISAGKYHTVGLKQDGTVVVAGSLIAINHTFEKWSNVVSVTAGDETILAVNAEGKVLIAGTNGALMNDVLALRNTTVKRSEWVPGHKPSWFKKSSDTKGKDDEGSVSSWSKEDKRNFLIPVLSTAAVIAVIMLTIVFGSLVPKAKYKQAEIYDAAGDSAHAAELFMKAGNYKDSAERFRETSFDALSNLKRNDIVYFGSYNGQMLQWTVLQTNNTGSMMICNTSVGSMQYNDKGGSAVTDDPLYHANEWPNCSLRKWLNDDFLKAAFSEREQKVLVLNSISTKGRDKNDGSSSDYVYILSNDDLSSAQKSVWWENNEMQDKEFWLRGSAGTNGGNALAYTPYYKYGSLSNDSDSVRANHSVYPIICISK